jgi:hypothetical protein
MLSDREDMVIIEYKNSLKVKATFKNIDGMYAKDDHITLRRLVHPSNDMLDPCHTVVILRLGMGEYVEVVNELAGS